MSDAEDIAAAAAEEAIAETEEERDRKRKERLEQNRLSARESRKRKKAMIEELQRTVITLSRDNKELNDKNEQLRRQLLDIGTKVRAVILMRGLDDAMASFAACIIFKTQAGARPTSPSFRGRQERSRSTQSKGDCNVMGFPILTVAFCMAKFFDGRLGGEDRGATRSGDPPESWL